MDVDRNVLVLFGGYTGETDTWEFSLSTNSWAKRATTGPTRKAGHAMVYDRSRHRTVLAGGGYTTASNEVWEWDGVSGTWTPATALPGQARSGHAMAYDTARDTIVLYGGLGSGVAGSTDVLERGPGSSAWIVRSSPDSNPQAQVAHCMAFDASRGRTVLVGEGTSVILVAEWDGTGTWEIRSFVTAIPPSRVNASLAYDSSRAKMVLTGGVQGTTNRTDTWDYDGTLWTQRANISPGGRDFHATAFDHVNNRVLLLGGLLGALSPQRDLLAFNGTSNTWSTVWTRFSPSPRDQAPVGFDEVGGRTIVYGGGLVTRPTINRGVGGGTFVHDGTNWVNATITGAPPVIWQAPLVYDSDRRVMILYGGMTGSGTSDTNAAREVWELGLSNLTWVDRTPQPTTPPGQRHLHAAAFDRAHHQMVVYGGINESGTRLGDTWVYNGANATWSQIGASIGPPGVRFSSSMAFDQRRGVTIMFGGAAGASGVFDNQTWQWDGVAWTNVTPASGNPPARAGHLLSFDPDRGTVLLTFGISGFVINRTPFTDLWEFDGAAWRQLSQTASPSPVARCFSMVTYDTVNRRIINFGGSSAFNANYLSGQTWLLPIPSLSCTADFNNDGDAGTDADIEAFFACIAGNCCPCCGVSDFDLDGDAGTDADIEAFFRVLAGGAC